MSQAVTAVEIIIPAVDANGADINPFSFAASIAALTVDHRSYLLNGNAFDDIEAFRSSYYAFKFFLLPANDATALSLYTTFKNTLAPGTSVQVTYSTQTLGV